MNFTGFNFSVFFLALSVLFMQLHSSLNAQNGRGCLTYEHHQTLLSSNPEYSNNHRNLEKSLGSIENNKTFRTQQLITIPVVFHVVYNTAAENISDLRLQEQLTVLNKDFRKLNSDTVNIPSVWKSLAADCQIEFAFAMYDPDGNPTNGITRTSTSTSSFTNNDFVKYSSLGGHDIWNAQHYLNIWVCDLASPILGYAQFPGGGTATDGVVVDYAVTGLTGSSAPFNLGRTATHEVGHWLSLQHIWGDDGDGSTVTPPSCIGTDNVTDTPNQGDQNTGTIIPGTIKISCANTPDGDMWMNYLDYTDDVSMCMFTQGQKTRILSTLNGIRSSIKNSPAIGINEVSSTSTISCFPNPSIDGIFYFKHNKGNMKKVDVFDLNGKEIYSRDLTDVADKLIIDLSNQTSGIYTIRMVLEKNIFFSKAVISR